MSSSYPADSHRWT